MPTLDQMVEEARLIDDPELLHRHYCRMIRTHVGYCAAFGKAASDRFNCHGYTYDIMATQGYMWQSLPLLIQEFDATRGKASTCWRKVTLRLIRKDAYDQTYVASVRVPSNTMDRYSSEALPCEDDEPIDEAFMVIMDVILGEN